MRLGAIQIHIKIGDVETLRTENWSIVPDDRQTKIETIGGVVVQDFGRVEAGDNYSCSVTMSTAAATVVFAYWHNRVLVNVRDVAGLVIPNMRIVVKKFSYVDRFENFIQADIELWRV
ncbi:MAG: phosphoribosylformylglycinamidine cyclo-ligase [Selenomonadaceae bacterium]|nr:phosphoribosylformylglycinamidine cyclo-ligase [Selenomonadaceae bacterium]